MQFCVFGLVINLINSLVKTDSSKPCILILYLTLSNLLVTRSLKNINKDSLAYGSTLYVRMTPKKVAVT